MAHSTGQSTLKTDDIYPKTELILYLEPNKDSALAQQVQAFYDHSRTAPWAAHANEALKYPAHITMVGFFDQPADKTIVLDMIQFLDLQLPHWFSQRNETGVAGCYPPPDHLALGPTPAAFVQGLIRPKPNALLVAIKPSETLLGLLSLLRDQFPVLGLRLKKTNHLSLSYWDDDLTQGSALGGEQELGIDERERMHGLWTDQAEVCARKLIPCLTRSTTMEDDNSSSIVVEATTTSDRRSMDADLEPSGNENTLNDLAWDIVLYSIQGRNKLNGKAYPLEELRRWHL